MKNTFIEVKSGEVCLKTNEYLHFCFKKISNQFSKKTNPANKFKCPMHQWEVYLEGYPEKKKISPKKTSRRLDGKLLKEKSM